MLLFNTVLCLYLQPQNAELRVQGAGLGGGGLALCTRQHTGQRTGQRRAEKGLWVVPAPHSRNRAPPLLL